MIQDKTYLCYWIWIPVILIAGFWKNDLIDIHNHDTYYDISTFHAAIVVSLFLLISGLGYFIYRTGLNSALKKAHGWLTALGFMLLVILWFLQYRIKTNELQGEFSLWNTKTWNNKSI